MNLVNENYWLIFWFWFVINRDNIVIGVKVGMVCFLIDCKVGFDVFKEKYFEIVKVNNLLGVLMEWFVFFYFNFVYLVNLDLGVNVWWWMEYLG